MTGASLCLLERTLTGVIQMADKQWVGSETFEAKRDKPMPNIGPGHIAYGHGERFANQRSSGGNLPFTQKIEENEGPTTTTTDVEA